MLLNAREPRRRWFWRICVAASIMTGAIGVTHTKAGNGYGANVAQSIVDEPPSLNSETIWVPLTLSDSAGVAQTLRLEATLYRLGKPGPAPLVVFNHGSTDGVGPFATLKYEAQARFFLSRGFSMVVPMRRGRGRSDGNLPETSCCRGDCHPGFGEALKDLDAVIVHMKRQSYVDGDRIVLAGQSRGGMLAVAYAGLHPNAVRGVINFAGGWTSTTCRQQYNTQRFAEAGAGSAIPMLWLYAENDSYYSVRHIRENYAAFVSAGGKAEFLLVPPIENNGHYLLNEGALWEPTVRNYLKRLQLTAD